jgi:hypothetical protein
LFLEFPFLSPPGQAPLHYGSLLRTVERFRLAQSSAGRLALWLTRASIVHVAKQPAKNEGPLRRRSCGGPLLKKREKWSILRLGWLDNG